MRMVAVYASMTGSGSAVYGIFESSDMADAVKRECEEIYKGWHFMPANCSC